MEYRIISSYMVTHADVSFHDNFWIVLFHGIQIDELQ
jgi:hypothetical protein